MTNAWGTDLVDGTDLTWNDVIYQPRVEPPPPAYDPASDLDSWESPAMAEQGLSTISGDPFDGGHATAATGYEDYSAPQYQAPEPQNPLLDPVMQEALAGFNWTPQPDGNDLANAEGLQGYLAGQEVAPEWYDAHPGAAPPGYLGMNGMQGPEAPSIQYNPLMQLDPSQVDDQRNAPPPPVRGGMMLGGLGLVDANGNPIDPSMYQYFGFGATSQPLNSASRSILSNPQFAESNAQFDATVSPGNRTGPGILGGALNFIEGAASPAYDASTLAREGVKNAFNYTYPYNFHGTSPSGYSPAPRETLAGDILGEAAGIAAPLILPASALDVALMGAGPLGEIGDAANAGRIAERGFGTNFDTLGKKALDELPIEAARGALARRTLENPESVGGAIDRTVFNIAGASGDAFKDPIPPSWIGNSEDAARGVSHFKVGDYTVGVENLSGNTDELVVNIERNGVADAAAYTERTPGGTATSLRSVGEFIQQLADANPEKRILAEASDARRLDAYARMGFKQTADEGVLELDRPALDAVMNRGKAATAVAEPAARSGEDFAGNIRLAKLPPDIRETVTNWAESNPDLVDAARRGVRSDAQVLEDAKNLVNDLGGDFNKLQRSWRPGDAWNAETVTAIRGALTDSTRKVMDAATLARTADTTENQIALAEAILEQQRTQQIVTGVTAEAGRALRAFRQNAAEALQDGDVGKMQQILKMAIGKNDSADISMLSDAIKALDLNDPVAINNFIRNVNKPGFWDYFTEFYYNSILSGPWTHMRNAIGNTAATMSEPIRRAGAAAVETPLARLQGRAPERFWQEAPASVVGAVHGIPEGIRGALDTIRTGFDPSAASRIELRRQTAIPGPLGKAIRVPSTALEAADSFFHAINYRSSLYANATRAARSEGLKGSALTDRVAKLVAEPTPRLIKQSADDAERLLFRNDPGAFANWLARGKEQFPALQFITPFVKTPANILKFGIRNSPLGLLDVPMWRRVLAENPAGSDELAQTLIGSAVALGLGSLVANGQLDITAGVPTDAASRDAFYRQGKLPFAVKVPGVGWVQYNQIPGLDTTLTSLAAVVEGVRNGDNVDDIASQVGGTIAQSMLDRSYMSGLSDFMDAVGDPSRFAARYATRQATSAVPFSAFFRQIAQAMDPTIRDPKSLEDSFKANLPGLTGDVPPRLTALGDEAKRSAPSPIQVSTRDASSLDAELERLGVNVTFVGSSIAGHGLSDAEQRDYQELAGKTTAELLGALIADPRYQSLDDAGKQNIIEKAITMARDDAREMLKQNNYRIPAGAR